MFPSQTTSNTIPWIRATNYSKQRSTNLRARSYYNRSSRRINDATLVLRYAEFAASRKKEKRNIHVESTWLSSRSRCKNSFTTDLSRTYSRK